MRFSVLGSAQEADGPIPTRAPASLALLGTCEGVENRVSWKKLSDRPTTLGEDYSNDAHTACMLASALQFLLQPERVPV